MGKTWRQFLRRWHPEGIPWPATIFYNAISQSRIFEEHYQLVADDVARHCGSGRILDIGTGPGWLLLALQRSLPKAEVVGVDISPAMVATAEKNLARAGGSVAIELKTAAADVLPFPDDSFDAVVSTGSMHHWKKPIAALNEVYRVLKPGHKALMYDLVKKMPSSVVQLARSECGRFRTTLLWLHSFEEPFCSTEDMEALAARTNFAAGHVRFVGVLCYLALQKREDRSANT